MQRIYHRDEQGLITTEDAKDWSKSSYIEHVSGRTDGLVSQGAGELLGWPDNRVEWYGHTTDSAQAVGCPLDEPDALQDAKRHAEQCGTDWRHQYALDCGWDAESIRRTAEEGASEFDRQALGEDAADELEKWCRENMDA